MQVTDEKALFERAQKSAAGFGALFDAYYDRIYAYAFRRVAARAAAEDIAASVFEDALRGIKRVRWQGKPMIAWLYRIAARRVADHYRQSHRETSLDTETVVMADGSEGAERAEDHAAVQHALEKLSANDREIIRLAFFDELGGAEIAVTLNCTPNNAYVRLHRALKRLETVMQDESERRVASVRRR
jgi:RNA polymerase sigma-70 factor (ECF subfamily)